MDIILIWLSVISLLLRPQKKLRIYPYYFIFSFHSAWIILQNPFLIVLVQGLNLLSTFHLWILIFFPMFIFFPISYIFIQLFQTILLISSIIIGGSFTCKTINRYIVWVWVQFFGVGSDFILSLSIISIYF